MNVSLRKFGNYDLTGNAIGKKEEELKKGKEEELKEEKPQKLDEEGPRGEKPASDGSTEMANYAKALILNPRDGGNINPAKSGITGQLGKLPMLDELINRWNANHETMSNEEKMAMLTQIIDSFGDGDERANIWRVRRYTVSHEISTQNFLQFLQDHPNGGYIAADVPSSYIYEGQIEDANVYESLRPNTGNITYEQKLEVMDCAIKGRTETLLFQIICSKAENINDPETWEQQAYNNSGLISGYIHNYITLGWGMQNESWFDFYVNEYESQYNQLRDNINEMSPDEVQEKVSNFQRMIEKLREEGFPYCDELLIALQGVLVYAGMDELNVLPSPEE